MSKPFVFFDIEVYPNYVLLLFKKEGEFIFFEKFGEKENFNSDINEINDILDSSVLVGYNIENYDNEILSFLLSEARIENVYNLSKSIISRDKYGRHSSKVDYEYVDLILYFNNSRFNPIVGLKKLAMIESHEILETLPFDPDLPLEETQLDKIRFYCKNDVNITEKMFIKQEKTIKARKKVSESIGLDIINMTQSEIGDLYISKKLKEAGASDLLKRPNYHLDYSFSFDENDLFEEKVTEDSTEEMLTILKELKKIRFSFEPVDFSNNMFKHKTQNISKKVTIGGTTYSIRLGGLHGTSEKYYVIKEGSVALDVSSYYPYLILNYGYYPKHLGKKFRKVYQELVDNRIEAKMNKKSEEADFLKIAINSVYGKFGAAKSYTNYLYSPENMYNVTITGQYLLLILINKLTENGIKVIEANTDGILIEDGDFEDVIELWQEKYHINLEKKILKTGLIKDVSNRVYYYDNGDVSGKGCFDYKKQPKFFVIYKAIAANKIHGTPIDEFIKNHKILNDFLYVGEARNSSSDTNKKRSPSKVLYSFLENEDGKEVEQIPKLVRYYKSKTSKLTIKAKREADGIITDVRYFHGDNVGIANDITDKDKILNDLDLDFYILQTKIALGLESKKSQSTPRKTKKDIIKEAFETFKVLYVGQRYSKYRLKKEQERRDYSLEELLKLVGNNYYSLKRAVEKNECLIDVDNVESFNSFLADSELLDKLKIKNLKASTITKRGAHYRLLFSNEESCKEFIKHYKDKYEGVEFKKEGDDETIAPSVIKKDGETIKYKCDTFKPYIIDESIDLMPKTICISEESSVPEVVNTGDNYSSRDAVDNKKYDYQLLLNYYPNVENGNFYFPWLHLCFAFAEEIKRGSISKEEAVNFIHEWAIQNPIYNHEKYKIETRDKIELALSRKTDKKITMKSIEKLVKNIIELKIVELCYDRNRSHFSCNLEEIKELFDNFAVYSYSNRGAKTFCNLKEGKDLSELEFNKMHLNIDKVEKDKKVKSMSPSSLFLSKEFKYSYKTLNGRGYNPNYPDDQTYIDQFSGMTLLNEYHYNPGVSFATDEEYDKWGEEVSTLFENHCLMLSNFNKRDAEYLRDYYTWIIQNPAKRQSYAPLISSSREGIGKSFLSDLMRKILGDRNSQSVTGERFFSSMKFNAKYTKVLLLFIEEISSSISGNKTDTMNLLKDLITGEKATVEQKFKEPVEIENFVNYTFLTNERTVLRASESTRRIMFFIVDVPVLSKEADTFFKDRFKVSRRQYGQNLYEVVNDLRKVKVLKRYLMTEITPKYYEEAPETESKKLYISEHDTVLLGFQKKELLEIIKSEIYPGVTEHCFNHNYLIQAMDDSGLNFKNVSYRADSFMVKIYGELGYEPIRPLIGGKRPRVYVKRSISKNKNKVNEVLNNYDKSLRRRNGV